MRKALAIITALTITTAASAVAFADGPGHCGTYNYWDADECECVDARGIELQNGIWVVVD